MSVSLGKGGSVASICQVPACMFYSQALQQWSFNRGVEEVYREKQVIIDGFESLPDYDEQ